MKDSIPEEFKTLQVDITSWSQFLGLVPMLHYGDWLFRGHASENWKLRSGLDREREERERNRKKWDRAYRSLSQTDRFVWMTGRSFQSSLLSLPNTHAEERAAIEEYIRFSPQPFDGTYRSMMALSEMQHYGAKTRLLDFTESVFVALFFAFESKTSPDKRALYAINREKLFSVCAPLIERSQTTASTTDEGFVLEVNRHALEEECSLRAAEKNVTNTDQTCRGVIPVFLRGSNKRIAAQNGCFLLSTSFDSFDVNLAKTFSTTPEELARPSRCFTVRKTVRTCSFLDVSIVKFVFSHRMEDSAWDILDHANINPRTIYPDRIGLAKSVRYES